MTKNETWNQIVDRHAAVLYGVAFRVLRNRADAEDVVQDVLLEAYRLSGAGRVTSDMPLLRRMTLLRSIDRLRQRKPVLPCEEGHLALHRDTPDACAERSELAARLQLALAQLPPRQAECFALRYVEGLSCQQIADALGIKLSAVTTALHKARQNLRMALDANIDSETPP